VTGGGFPTGPSRAREPEGVEMVTFSLISTCARGTTRMRGVSDKSSGVRASPKAEEFRKGLRTREGTRHKK
jgi:hypothetical protein